MMVRRFNWFGREKSVDPQFGGRMTSRLNNAIFEAKNRGMDYIRAKYGSQLTSRIEKQIQAALTGKSANNAQANAQTVDKLTGKPRTAFDNSRFTGNSNVQHAAATPDNPSYVPPVEGPAVWKSMGQWNLENDLPLAQGSQRPGATPSTISSMITSLLRQSQNAAGDTLTGMFSKAPGQYYLGARDSSSWGVDPVFAPVGANLPVPKDGAAPPASTTTGTDLGTTVFQGGAQPAMNADAILRSSLGGFGFLSGAQAPGVDVNTTMSAGAPAPSGAQAAQAATDPNLTIKAADGASLLVSNLTTDKDAITAFLTKHGGSAPIQTTTGKWVPNGTGGWVWDDGTGHPPMVNQLPPTGAPPKPTTDSRNAQPTPAPDPDFPPILSGGGRPTPNADPKATAMFNPFGFGLGAGGIDASGHPVNAVMGPDSAFMANATMQAMSLANSYFAPQRLELAYQLGDMETDMRRMAVNLGRQTDDPVLQAKLFKEANQAVRTLDTQQNTFAFQMAEQRRQEEQQNWQFYSSLAQEEFKFSNQLSLAVDTFNLQRFQVMHAAPADTTPKVSNALSPQPNAGAATQLTGSFDSSLQGGNLLTPVTAPKGLGV